MLLNNRNQDGYNKHKGHSLMKHVGMMGICCLLPIVVIGMLTLFGIRDLRTNPLVLGVSSFICPIMMVVMMIVMFRSGKTHNCCSKDSEEKVNIENK